VAQPAVARADAGAAPGAAASGQAAPTSDGSVRGLADQAWQQYSRAQDLLRQGNFAAYGEELRRLEGTLKALRGRTN
jgi:hypothetical protein